MISLRRLATTPSVAILVCLFLGSAASAGDRYRDESAYREYRAAKRQQVSNLCGTWFAIWRPGTVGDTYVSLAAQYDAIDISECSPTLRRHVMKSERVSRQVGELFGQGAMPDIDAVFMTVQGGGGVRSSSSVTSERGRRVLELMRELSASEEAMVKELNSTSDKRLEEGKVSGTDSLSDTFHHATVTWGNGTGKGDGGNYGLADLLRQAVRSPRVRFGGTEAMGWSKTLARVLRGSADANIGFNELCRLLEQHLGFAERVRDDHHIVTLGGVEEILNLQPRGSLAKAYQVKQVRDVIVRYRLAEEDDAE